MNIGAIFPLFYLPPIEYFSKLQQHNGDLLIDKAEHFPKQTYRNRASIHSPNGKLDLAVPVLRGAKNHTKVKDVRISYDFDWQRLHWLSMQTSYRRSAYFEYYEDAFAPFYEKKTEFLFDFNEGLFQVILKSLKLKASYAFAEEYEASYTDRTDYRSSIHPKITSDYISKPYYQVFEERNGFISNLSIVDLLFNKGPQSSQFL